MRRSSFRSSTPVTPSRAWIPVTNQETKVGGGDDAVTIEVPDRRVGESPERDEQAEVSGVDAAVEVEITPREIAGVGDLVQVLVLLETVGDVAGVRHPVAVAVGDGSIDDLALVGDSVAVAVGL